MFIDTLHYLNDMLSFNTRLLAMINAKHPIGEKLWGISLSHPHDLLSHPRDLLSHLQTYDLLSHLRDQLSHHMTCYPIQVSCYPIHMTCYPIHVTGYPLPHDSWHFCLFYYSKIWNIKLAILNALNIFAWLSEIKNASDVMTYVNDIVKWCHKVFVIKNWYFKLE